MLQGVLSISSSVGKVLADYTADFTSPPVNNTLRMADGSTVALVLAAPANSGYTALSIEGLGGVQISGTLRGDTELIIGGETVVSSGEVSASFGKLTVPIQSPVTGTHSVGTAVSLSRTTILAIPVSTVSTEKAPKNIYTSKLPAFGFLIARGLLPTAPKENWSVKATHKLSGAVLEGRISKVTGGAANVYVWVGDP